MIIFFSLCAIVPYCMNKGRVADSFLYYFHTKTLLMQYMQCCTTCRILKYIIWDKSLVLSIFSCLFFFKAYPTKIGLMQTGKLKGHLHLQTAPYLRADPVLYECLLHKDSTVVLHTVYKHSSIWHWKPLKHMNECVIHLTNVSMTSILTITYIYTQILNIYHLLKRYLRCLIRNLAPRVFLLLRRHICSDCFSMCSRQASAVILLRTGP